MRIEHDLHDLLMCARTLHAHSRALLRLHAARGCGIVERHGRPEYSTAVVATEMVLARSDGATVCTGLYSRPSRHDDGGWKGTGQPSGSCCGAAGTSNSAPRRRRSGGTQRSSAWPTPRPPPAAGGTAGASTARSRTCRFTGLAAQVRSLTHGGKALFSHAVPPCRRAMLRCCAAPRSIGAAQRIRAPSRLPATREALHPPPGPRVPQPTPGTAAMRHCVQLSPRRLQRQCRSSTRGSFSLRSKRAQRRRARSRRAAARALARRQQSQRRTRR